MRHGTVILALTIKLLLILSLMGCAGTSKPSKFYLLLTLPDAEDPAQLTANSGVPSVLVGPITLAAYLDRDKIVTRTGGNELAINEFARWGEPLQDNFYRVLIDNLSYLLNTSEVYSFHRNNASRFNFQVAIDVIRFDSTQNGASYLSAFWSILGEDGRTILLNRKSVFHVQPSSSDTAGLVEAQNKALSEFSHEIAATIRSLNS